MSTPSSPPCVAQVDQFAKRFKDAEEALSKTERTLAHCMSIAMDAPKSPRVTEADRARWHKEAVLARENAHRNLAACMVVTNESRKDLKFLQGMVKRGEVVADRVQEYKDRLEEAVETEMRAEVDFNRMRWLERDAKRKWESFFSEESVEFRRKVRAFGGETVRLPRHFRDSDSEDNEPEDDGLNYHPSSPSYSPRPVPASDGLATGSDEEF